MSSQITSNLKLDPRYLKGDETVKEYIRAEKTDPSADRKLPAPPHIESTPSGTQYVVHDPEAITFDLNHSAPLKTAEDIEAEDETLNYDRPNMPEDHHLEVQHEDEASYEMLQDDAMSEDQMMDEAIIRRVFDRVEGGDNES